MSYGHQHGLAPKQPDWDARSVNSALSETEQSVQNTGYSTQGHNVAHKGYPASGHESAFPQTSYTAYPPSYARQEEEARFGSRPQTAADGDVQVRSRGNDRRTVASRWKKPWFCWIISAAQLATFIGQCVHGWKLTGSPIQIKPTFNPMIGPSVYNSINMGARFVPCMKYLTNITDVVTAWPCPNTTTTAGLSACTLTELCSNGAEAGSTPAQWWRFIVPIFLHAGIVHIAFNLMVQLRLGTQMEMEIGTFVLIPIYFAAGIGGFLFGGNFAGNGITSTGASGAIFSIISLSLLDLLYRWKQIETPRKALIMLLADIVISFVLGLLPGVDNFSHIGGFIIGLLLGIAFMRNPDSLERSITPYQKVNMVNMDRDGTATMAETPANGASRDGKRYLESRSTGWWIFVGLRLLCVVLTVIVFILLIKNFYNLNAPTCKWCKYLSCIPVSNWCSIGDITTTTTTTSTTTGS